MLIYADYLKTVQPFSFFHQKMGIWYLDNYKKEFYHVYGTFWHLVYGCRKSLIMAVYSIIFKTSRVNLNHVNHRWNWLPMQARIFNVRFHNGRLVLNRLHTLDPGRWLQVVYYIEPLTHCHNVYFEKPLTFSVKSSQLPKMKK